MKNLSLRELALMCSPLLIVATVGFLMSRRKPSANEGKLHLTFRVEKPTTLEAFKGADATFIVNLAGDDADKLHIYSSTHSLELKSKSKTYHSSRYSDDSRFWNGVWKGNLNDSRFAINTQQIPPGKLRFNFTAQTAPLSSGTPSPTRPPHLNASWPINRALIKSPDFKQMPREPFVILRSVKVVSASGTRIDGECVFDLVGSQMNAQTRTDMSFSGGVETQTAGSSGISWSPTTSAMNSPNPRQRSWMWSVFSPSGTNAKLNAIVSGNLSVEERWPLAFQIAPFDPHKVKVAQSLRFSAGPAPVPSA